MNRKIAAIVALLCMLAPAIAQPRLDSPEYQLGVQGGVTASMMHFSPRITQSALNPHLGATAGLVFRYNGHKYCGLQVELNWMERGWHETETGYTRDLHYIETPFLAHIYFGKRFRGYINIGPEIGALVYSAEHNRPEEDARQYAHADNRFYWGAAGGAGMYGRSVAGCWQLEARFAYGLGTLFNNAKADVFDNSNTMTLSLKLAWLWEFKQEKQRPEAGQTR
ncbi:MAG: PorT family protein [Paludibacteraceae bacterium]|nr:PorT family protein [Paludibacteraceae bacterium]